MVLWVEGANQSQPLGPPVSVKLYNPSECSECGPVKSLLAACKTIPAVTAIVVVIIQSQISPEPDCRLRVLLVSTPVQSSPDHLQSRGGVNTKYYH